MKAMKLSLVLIMVTTFTSMPVLSAPPSDGNNLLKTCNAAIKTFSDNNERINRFDVWMCLGTVRGATDVLVSNRAGQGPYRNCVPETGITLEKRVRIVHKYLQDNPSQLHKRGTELAITALVSAFPCE